MCPLAGTWDLDGYKLWVSGKRYVGVMLLELIKE